MPTGYVFTHQGQQHTPDGPVNVQDTKAHNEALDKANVLAWCQSPDTFMAYVKAPLRGSYVTTWLGKELGTIRRVTLWRNNLGARMATIRVVSITGAEYYGTYGYQWNELVTLRRAKSHPPTEPAEVTAKRMRHVYGWED